MPKNEMGFTIKRIREYPSPDGGRTFVYDTKQPCLRLQITKAGTKTFQFYSWVKGRGATTITLGSVEKVSYEDAKKKVIKILSDISENGVKAIDEIKATSKESTFEELFNSWYEGKLLDGKTKHLINCKSRFENHIKPTMGKKKFSTLTESFLKNWHRKLLKRKSKRGKGTTTISRTTANRCLQVVTVVFNETMKENPAKGVSHFKEKSRERYLNPQELRRLFKALDEPQTSELLRDIVLLALTTGARKSNILSLMWSEIDLDQGIWIIPAKKSKNKEQMYIPLISEAIEILERRKKHTKSVFVFSAKTKKGHVFTVHKRFKKLLERANIEDFVFHDLRRTCGSWQALTGNSILMIGKSLGHQSTESTKVYARIKDSNPVRDSMATGFKAMVEASKEKKIVNIKGGE